MNKILTAALLAALASGAVSVQAYETGDWILRLGAVTVSPSADSDKIVLPTSPPTVLAGVWYIDIETTAKIKTDVGSVKFDVDVNPWVYNIGIAYKF